MEKERFSSLTAAVLPAVLVIPLYLWAFASAAHGSGVSALPVAAQHSVSAALGRDNPDYYAQADGANFKASAARQKLTFHFTPQGVELCSGSARWSMHFGGYGY